VSRNLKRSTMLLGMEVAAGVLSLLTQLNPPLPLETSKGPGWAHFVIDYGPEAALLWVVFLDQDGACWTVPNQEVRMCINWTLGRRKREDSAEQPKPSVAGKGGLAEVAQLRTHPAHAGLKNGP
jgi:hypothetical protein